MLLFHRFQMRSSSPYFCFRADNKVRNLSRSVFTICLWHFSNEPTDKLHRNHLCTSSNTLSFSPWTARWASFSRIHFIRSNSASLEKMNFFNFTEVSAEVGISSAREPVLVLSRRPSSFMVFWTGCEISFVLCLLFGSFISNIYYTVAIWKRGDHQIRISSTVNPLMYYRSS